MPPAPMDLSLVVTGVADDLPVAVEATSSRAVVDNEATRVVIFAFDTGQQLTEHSAPPPVVVQVIRGHLRFEVADGVHDLHPGDVVYLAPREPHSLEALEPSLLSLVMIKR